MGRGRSGEVWSAFLSSAKEGKSRKWMATSQQQPPTVLARSLVDWSPSDPNAVDRLVHANIGQAVATGIARHDESSARHTAQTMAEGYSTMPVLITGRYEKGVVGSHASAGKQRLRCRIGGLNPTRYHGSRSIRPCRPRGPVHLRRKNACLRVSMHGLQPEV